MLTILPAGQGLAAAFWLGVVILLILAASRAVRYLPIKLLPAARLSGQLDGTLTLRGSMALDSRRRIYLIDAGGRQALILTGGPTDTVLGLPPAPV